MRLLTRLAVVRCLKRRPIEAPEIPDQAARSERHYEEVNDPDEHWRRKLHSDSALRERLFDPKWRRLHAIAAQGFGTIERSIGGIE